jgi:hypothetical protein
MGEKKWYKPVFLTLVVLGVVLTATGASLTEPGTEELAYGSSGSFFIDDSHVEASIIVFTDNEDVNCEDFDLTVDRWDGSYDFVPVEKTSCERWSLPNSYQFRLNNLTEERYGFSASGVVSIVAVQGDLDAYMEDYASGNSIADLGTSMCCLSILLHVFIGRGIAKARNTEQQVVVKQTYIDAYNQPASVQAAQTVESVPVKPAPAEPDGASLQETVKEEVQEVLADASLAETLQETAASGGAFWDNIAED